MNRALIRLDDGLSEQPVYSDLPEFLTTLEAARFLRCSKAHFCNLLNGVVAGVPPLPYLRLGRRKLVRKTAAAARKCLFG